MRQRKKENQKKLLRPIDSEADIEYNREIKETRNKKMLAYEKENKIRNSMIEAASLARLVSEYHVGFAVEIIENLSPLVGGWLPNNVIRNESGKIVVLSR
jgi:hypothetical protein